MDHYKLTPREASCPVCYSKKARLLYLVDSGQAAQHFVLKEVNEQRFTELRSHIKTLWQRGACDVVRCEECGFCFASPYVAGDGRFYALAYGNGKPGYPTWKWEFQLTYDTLQDMMRHGNLRDPNVLELGAGNGAFVKRVAPALTPKENVLCTEYSDYGKREISGYGIACLSEDIRDLGSTSRFEGHFDVVCMFQVLEHMDNLDTLFEQLTWLTSKHATLFVAVPNAKRIEFNECNGALLDMPPNHVGRWNQSCFKIMAQRHGWSVVRHEIEKDAGLMSKARGFMAWRYLRKSQGHNTIANRIERIHDPYLRQRLKAAAVSLYALGSLPALSALRSRGWEALSGST